jgi:hypothetical protein
MDEHFNPLILPLTQIDRLIREQQIPVKHRYQFKPVTTKNIGKNYLKAGRKTYR